MRTKQIIALSMFSLLYFQVRKCHTQWCRSTTINIKQFLDPDGRDYAGLNSLPSHPFLKLPIPLSCIVIPYHGSFSHFKLTVCLSQLLFSSSAGMVFITQTYRITEPDSFYFSLKLIRKLKIIGTTKHTLILQIIWTSFEKKAGKFPAKSGYQKSAGLIKGCNLRLQWGLGFPKLSFDIGQICGNLILQWPQTEHLHRIMRGGEGPSLLL